MKKVRTLCKSLVLLNKVRIFDFIKSITVTLKIRKMNKQRRKKLQELVDKLIDLNTDLEGLKDEEQEETELEEYRKQLKHYITEL